MAGYLETLLASLDDVGKQLVAGVLDKGKQVRDVDSNFRTKARELIGIQVLHFQQQKNDLTKNLEQFVSSANLEDENVVRNLKEFISFQKDEVAHSYIHRISTIKQFITHHRQQIEKMKEFPPGIELRQQCIDEFNTALDKLLDHAATLSIKIPWQIRQCAAADPTDQSAVVPLEGGKILDAEGRNIWGCDCYYCGGEIQGRFPYELLTGEDGSLGENVARYHCIDVPFTDMCDSCFEIRLVFIKKLDHCITKEVPCATYMPDFAESHEETNIPVFMRFSVSEAKSLPLAFHNACTVYKNRPCFGTIHSGSIQYMSYHDIHEQAMKVAISLKNLLENSLGLHNLLIGICSSNRPEWMLTDFACTLNKYVSVGMHTQWPLEEFKQIIHETGIQCLVCDHSNLPKFLSIGHPLKCIVVMDDISVSSMANDTKLFTWSNLVEGYFDRNVAVGCGLLIDSPLVPSEAQEAEKDRLFSLIYSSGTTGEPKGIMVMENNWRVDNVMQPNFMVPYVICSYSPLAHGMDRGLVWQAVMNGGQVVFCDSAHLLHHIQIVQPALFVAMPYFWNQIFANFQEERSKLESDNDAPLWKLYSTTLGSRLKVIATGGAPISEEVVEFMKRCFSECLILNVYGTTEAPGISTNGKVGPGVDVQLKIDEQYNVDNQVGNRKVGEIIVKTVTMSPGYFNNPAKTNESFVNGYFCTGDIGEFDDNGNLRIIDRKKNFLEIYVDGRSVWIPSGVVESVLSKCSCINQIFAHGERTQHVLIAVVVPNWSFVVTLAQRLSGKVLSQEGEAKAWLSQHNDAVEAAILSEINFVGEASGLKPYEIPQAVVIDYEGWTTENGLLTATQKNARNKLLTKYRLHIDLKYAHLNSQDSH